MMSLSVLLEEYTVAPCATARPVSHKRLNRPDHLSPPNASAVGKLHCKKSQPQGLRREMKAYSYPVALDKSRTDFLELLQF